MYTACHALYSVQWFVLFDGYFYYRGSKYLIDKYTTERCPSTSVLSAVCMQCPIWLFHVVPWLRSFQVLYSGVVWNILRSFQLPLLLLVIAFVFTVHKPYISIVRSSYFIIFSASFLITFLSPKIATSINKHVPFYYHRL